MVSNHKVEDSVLVIAPHPDDEIIGCGGSLIKHLIAGRNIDILYMTSGDKGVNAGKVKDMAKVRENEAIQAWEFLGLNSKRLHFLRLPDAELTFTPDISNKINKVIRQLRPATIYLPHRLDNHPDHEATYSLCIDAIEKAGYSYAIADLEPWYCPTVLAYEVWNPISKPGYVEDISGQFDRKQKSLTYHKSQLSVIPYSHLIQNLNGYRGILSGVKYAEAFKVIRLKASSIT